MWICCIFFQIWLLSGFTVNGLVDVALTGTATQSSTFGYGYASNAIDGNTDSYYYDGSCSHTNPGVGNWWSVLLPGVYRIDTISITNRNEFPSRINGAEILIGKNLENNGNNNPICAVISSIPTGGTSSFNCSGMIGRLVNVFLPANNPLTMCEVQVFGVLAAPFPSFGTVVSGRNVAVVQMQLCWSDALFYCRDFYWDLFSVRGEQDQQELEEVLGATSFPLTRLVWLGLRRYLLAGTWFWMPGEPANYTNWETNVVWQITSPCGGIETKNSFYWRDHPCSDSLNFICLTDVQRDVDCVEFFSSTRPQT
ncbi:pentraxin fusion protein-like isoform X2 [Betta splendens]|uniref:Pentraxin fusion protein-like isoform X2 n=1 Tax=Betta splendens TaxID=158456 RepID=A0A6P7LZ14_BETSP|nr:pentraxin fusion protein-like isoform X2 [Betta splendens]XP_040925840.1 pentraxin fusion protein-like isoform X2 [Betta splendens]